MSRKLVRSIKFAIGGVAYTLRTQRNAQIEVVIGILVIAVASWLRVNATEWAVLLLTIAAVLAVETFNTAIEQAVDLLSPERKESAKRAKDAAAGAVLIVSIAAAVVGFIILGPPLIEHLRR